MHLSKPSYRLSLVLLGIIMGLCVPQNLVAQRKKASVKDSLPKASIEYFKENYLRAEDFVYKPNIKTVLFYREGFVLTSPVINLNGEEKLVLDFDDLDGTYKRMRYTLILATPIGRPPT